MSLRHVVIIGNGMAGFSAARRLRREDSDVTISIFSDEAHPFYLRSRLRDYICGALGEYEMILESRNLYRREGLNLFLQSPVASIDTAAREVALAGGDRVRYDALLLATGARPTPPDLAGGQAQGVFSLRTLADAEAIRQYAAKARRAVILGEGIVSLQFAQSLACLGLQVDYLLLGDHFWPEALDPAASRMVEDLLSQLGVRVHKRMRVTRIVSEGGAVAGVELADGRTVACDMVGHGCGFRPDMALVQGTSIGCNDDGVVVNDCLETSVEGVYAAGDVISRGCEKGRTTLNSLRWQNSFLQGETAALNILGRRQPVTSFGLALRTTVADVSLAILGRGNLAEEAPDVHVESALGERNYRRLVFQHDILVGAILMGDIQQAAIIEQQIRRGAMRGELSDTILPALAGGRQPRLTEPLRSGCPICTGRIALPRGALVGSEFACKSCSNRLRLTYSEGRLAVVPAEE